MLSIFLWDSILLLKKFLVLIHPNLHMMTQKYPLWFSLVFTLFYLPVLYGQNNYTLQDVISDASNGEPMIGATVIIKALNTGITSNNYGFYSLSLPFNRGDHTVLPLVSFNWKIDGYWPIPIAMPTAYLLPTGSIFRWVINREKTKPTSAGKTHGTLESIISMARKIRLHDSHKLIPQSLFRAYVTISLA